MGHSVLVGDFNFNGMQKEKREQFLLNPYSGPGLTEQSQQYEHEEIVILQNKFEDVLHKLIEETTPTKYKTPRFPAWRPDKVVMQTVPDQSSKPVWRCTRAQIVGA